MLRGRVENLRGRQKLLKRQLRKTSDFFNSLAATVQRTQNELRITGEHSTDEERFQFDCWHFSASREGIFHVMMETFPFLLSKEVKKKHFINLTIILYDKNMYTL